MESSMKEAAARLEIGESTLRRWCAMLEKVGYSFERREDKRVIRKADVEQLARLRSLSLTMNLEDACREVVRTDARGADAIRRFENILHQLPEQLYWSTPESVIAELLTAWQDLRKELQWKEGERETMERS